MQVHKLCYSRMEAPYLWYCLQHWHLGPLSFAATFLPGSFGRLLLGILSESLPLSASPLQVPTKHCSAPKT